MALTKISTAMISQDAASVDLNIDAGTLYIDSTNNRVGVGTTSPVFALHVHQTSNSQIHFTDNTSGSNVGDGLRVGWNGTVGQMWLFEDAALRFATNNTERVRIDSSGNLLISKTNTTFSTTGIELRAGNGGSRFIRSNAEPILLNRTGSDGKIIGVYKDGSEVGSIFTDNSGDLGIGNDDTGLLFVGGSDLIAPWNPTGPASRDAVISLGNASNRFNNLYMAGTLYGPATFTIDPATHGDNTGTVVIAGNLQVDGTTTTINSTTLTVDDKLITLASGSANAAAANGAGIEVEISGATNPSLTYDGTNDEWDFNKDVNVTGTIDASGALTLNTGTNGVPTINLSHSNTGADNFRLQGGIPGISNGGFSIRDVDAGVNRLSINSDGNSTFSGDVTVQGLGVGSYNSSYDFYNNGTSYLNAAVTIDDSLTITGATLVRSGNTLTLNRTDNAIGGAMSYVQGTGFLLNDANGDGFSYNVGASNKVRFTSTGAATFSGTVTTTQLNLNSASYDNRQIGMDSNGFFIYNAADSRYDLKISDTDGNATFSGNVQLNSRLTFGYNSHYFEAGTNSLSFKNSSGTAYATINNTGISTTGTITFGDSHTIGNDADDNLVIASSAGENLIIDSADDIILDADGGDIKLKDGSTHWASLYTNGTNTYIQSMVNSGDVYLSGKDGSGNGVNALRLDMSNAGRAYFSAGASFNGNINANDNEQLILGTNDDFRIFHNGSGVNYVQSYTSAELRLESNGNTTIKTNNGDDMAVFVKNGAVELYYDDSKRFQTAASGVVLTSPAGSGQAVDLDFLSTNTSGFGSSYSIDSRIRSTTGGSSNAYHSQLQFYTNDTSNNLDLAMTIDPSQNVGIGDATPDWRFTVEGSSADDWISRIYNTATDGAGLLVRTDATSANDKIALGVYADSGYKMVVKSTGNVGIGTTNPYYKLDVYGANLSNGEAKNLALFFDTTSGTTGTGAGIAFGGYTNGTGGAINHLGNIQGIKENSTAGNYASALLFSTRANGATPLEQMRISSAGNVGIGRKDPSYGLDVKATGNSLARFVSSSSDALVRIIANNYATEADARLFLGEADSYGMTFEYDGIANIGYIGMNDNVDPTTGSYSKRIQFPRGSTHTSFMAGSVGIGTASPNSPLQVLADAGSSNSAVRIRNSNTTGRTTTLQLEDYTGGLADGVLKFVFPNAGSTTGSYLGLLYNSAGLYVGPGGNVGIGTNDPESKLHVTHETNISASATGAGQFRVQGSGYTTAIAMDSTRTHIYHNSSLRNLSFGTDESIDMTIEGATGYVGINTQDPSMYLHISGTSDNQLMLEGTSGSNVGLFYRQAGADKWELYHRGSDNQFTLYSYAASDRVMVVKDNGKMGVLNKDPNGNLHIGSGTDTSVTVGSATSPALQIGGTTNYRLGLYTDSEAGYIENKNGDNGIIFRVKTGGESMRLLKSGQMKMNGYPIQTTTDSGTRMYTGLATGSFYNSTGFLILKTNIPAHNTSGNANMFSISIEGFGYNNSTYGIIDMNIGCYSGENNYWNASYSGSNIPLDWVNNIYFAKHDSSGMLAVVIGTSTMSLPVEIACTKFIQGYVNVNEDYANGWDWVTTTSLGDYSSVTKVQPRTTRNPRFAASTNTPFSISQGSWQKISDSLSEDGDWTGVYDASNGRFTPTLEGFYQFNFGGYSSYNSSTGQERYALAFAKNGSLQYIFGGNYSAGDSPLAGGSQSIYLDSNDYVELWVYSSVAASWGHSSHRVWWEGYWTNS